MNKENGKTKNVSGRIADHIEKIFSMQRRQTEFLGS